MCQGGDDSQGERTPRFKWGVGQDGDPVHAGPWLGCGQQTARADPAQ